MLELQNAVKVLKAIAAINYTGAGTDDGVIIDRQGFSALMFACIVGVDAGLDGSNHLQFKLQHGDESNLSDAADVAAADILGSLTGVSALTTGIFAKIDATTEDDTAFKISYIGTKRYVRLSIIVTGATTDCPAAAMALLGRPGDAPVSDA